jgi:hypothetical protein
MKYCASSLTVVSTLGASKFTKLSSSDTSPSPLSCSSTASSQLLLYLHQLPPLLSGLSIDWLIFTFSPFINFGLLLSLPFSFPPLLPLHLLITSLFFNFYLLLSSPFLPSSSPPLLPFHLHTVSSSPPPSTSVLLLPLLTLFITLSPSPSSFSDHVLSFPFFTLYLHSLYSFLFLISDMISSIPSSLHFQFIHAYFS